MTLRMTEQDAQRLLSATPVTPRVRTAGRKTRRVAGLSTGSKLEERLALEMRAAGLPAPVRQYQFHPVRRWKADFAWLDVRLLVEVDGGTWTSHNHPGQVAGHSSGVGLRRDAEKLNEAVLAGFRLLRFTPDMVRDGSALTVITRALRAGKC